MAAEVTIEAESPPSAYAISDLAAGRPGAFGRTLGLTAQRALILLPGLYLAGLRENQLVRGAVYGSIGISVFLFLNYAAKR